MHVKDPSTVMIHGRKMAFDEVSPPNPKGTILLLTGLASKRLGWYRQLEEFGRYYRTIALDHRGTGDSDAVTEAYTIGDLADDAAAVLKTLGISQAHVVGMSLGGFVALQLALRHPEVIEKLVLISTSAGGSTQVAPGPDMIAMLNRRSGGVEVGELARQTYSMIMAPGYSESHPEELERIAENARYRAQTGQSYFLQLQAIMSHDVAQQLERISVPTLVIHGDVDPLVPHQNGHYLARHIKGARLILYPNVGHIPIIENAEELNRDVLAFLGN